MYLLNACEKETTDSDDDSTATSITGNYIGNTSYYSTATDISTENSQVRVYKESSTYNFQFYNGIPKLTSVSLYKDSDGSYHSTDTTGLINVDIVADTLTIDVTKSGLTWKASCIKN